MQIEVEDKRGCLCPARKLIVGMRAAAKAIPRDLRLAREQALLGNYEKAIKYFCRVGDGIKTVYDGLGAREKQQWKTMEIDVAAELRLVKELHEKLSHFEGKPGRPLPPKPKTPYDERQVRPMGVHGARPPTGVDEYPSQPRSRNSHANYPIGRNLEREW